MRKAVELSDQAARELYTQNKISCGNFDTFTEKVEAEICATHPQWEDAPHRTRFNALRAAWRAALAPIIYSAEVDLAHSVQQRLIEGVPLTSLTAQRLPLFDELFRMYGTFNGRPLAFLRSMSVLSRMAMNRTILAVKHDPEHPFSEAVRVCKQAEADIAPFFRSKGEYPQLKDPLERPRQHAVTANITALNILGPAALHCHMWSGHDDESIRSQMIEHLDELARTQYTTTSLHARHLPNYNSEYQKPPGVFSDTTERAEREGIWALPALQNEWPNKHWCPANINLESATGAILESAATMRLRTAAYVADGILWEASGQNGEVPLDHTVRMY